MKLTIKKTRLMVMIILIAVCMGGCLKMSQSDKVTKTYGESEQINSNKMPELDKDVDETTVDATTVEKVPDLQGDKVTDKAIVQVPGFNIPKDAHKIIIASDIHYLSKEMTDYGIGFNHMIEYGDGRVVQYCTEIVNAWMEEVIIEKPEVVILSGDLTFNGEKASHKELVSLLGDLKQHNIKVIVMPGNHDINNVSAAKFKGDGQIPANQISPSDFYQIYRDYGYNDAISCDTNSLSYVWKLSDDIRIMMIDSNMYEPYAKVGGMIKDTTYEWMEQQFKDADDAGAKVLTVTHHNMLDESEVYVDDCTIEHSSKEIRQFEKWGVTLHLSGHLHVQHYKKSSEDKDAFYEIVTASLTTPPCIYGVLYLNGEGEFSYRTRAVDMEKWAKTQGNTNKDLLNWNSFKNTFLKKVFINQAYAEFENLDIDTTLSESDKAKMADMYAKLNIAYYSGEAYKIADDIKDSKEYNMWINNGYASKFVDNIEFIINDARDDYNQLDSD